MQEIKSLTLKIFLPDDTQTPHYDMPPEKSVLRVKLTFPVQIEFSFTKLETCQFSHIIILLLVVELYQSERLRSSYKCANTLLPLTSHNNQSGYSLCSKDKNNIHYFLC